MRGDEGSLKTEDSAGMASALPDADAESVVQWKWRPVPLHPVQCTLGIGCCSVALSRESRVERGR